MKCQNPTSKLEIRKTTKPMYIDKTALMTKQKTTPKDESNSQPQQAFVSSKDLGKFTLQGGSHLCFSSLSQLYDPNQS